VVAGGKPEEQTNEGHRLASAQSGGVVLMVPETVPETAGGQAEIGIGWPQALLAVECSWS
jgi:hypothetical protein